MQGWPTHLNAFPANRAPLATNQAPPCAKSVQETPTQKKGPRNAQSVQKPPITQVLSLREGAPDGQRAKEAKEDSEIRDPLFMKAALRTRSQTEKHFVRLEAFVM